jgi:glycyl-tRNA synthetase
MEINMGDLGWTEMGGVHYRTDHDLKGHQEISKQNLSVFDEETKEKFIPHVLELSFGLDRNLQALITLAYTYDKKRNNVVLELPPTFASYQFAVFPLISKGKVLEMAKEIYNKISGEFNCLFDESGSIGRRYSRNDEIGTPYCITIDEQSLKNKDVTIRDRDTTKQIRVKVKDLKSLIKNLLDGKNYF